MRSVERKYLRIAGERSAYSVFLVAAGDLRPSVVHFILGTAAWLVASRPWRKPFYAQCYYYARRSSGVPSLCPSQTPCELHSDRARLAVPFDLIRYVLLPACNLPYSFICFISGRICVQAPRFPKLRLFLS